MKLPRRQFLHLAAGAAAVPAVSRMAGAQTYPTRPITMIVPFPPGGPSDVVGRVVAEQMRRSLGQPVIVENVSGADGSIGVGRLTRARPDGYTIDLGNLATHVLNGAFYSLRYDLLNDFAPIAVLASTSLVLFAKKAAPFTNLKELITWLKANPNAASMATTATDMRLLTAFFKRETGTQFGFVPYRDGSVALQDIIAGQIDLYFGAASFMPLLQAGGVKALAVTSTTRVSFAPEIPTMSEMSFPSLSYSAWFGLFAPRGTPTDIIERLNRAAAEAVVDQTVRSRLAELGFEAVASKQQTPESLGAMVKADAEKWWPIIKALGIKAE
jgi:tripartite-type tricarboxylate transporter receptor subunit TctC